MRRGEPIQLAPEVFVLYRLAIERPPASRFPISQPHRHPAFEIGRIGENFDVARFRQRGERADRGLQFHAIVRGKNFSTAHFFRVRAEFQSGRPTARPWISRTATVGMNKHFFQTRKCDPSFFAVRVKNIRLSLDLNRTQKSKFSSLRSPVYFRLAPFPARPNVRSIRIDDWKLIHYPNGDGSPDRFKAELYDLRNDPLLPQNATRLTYGRRS